MKKLNGNIFKQAKKLLRSKSILDMNGEELTTVKAALIPLDLLPQFQDMTTNEGLEKLSKMFDGGIKSPGCRRQNSIRRKDGMISKLTMSKQTREG